MSTISSFPMVSGNIGVAEFGREMRAATSNMTWLTHWGLHEDHPIAPWKAGHVSGKVGGYRIPDDRLGSTGKKTRE